MTLTAEFQNTKQGDKKEMPRCITRETLAERLQCHVRTISRAMQDGDLLPISTDPVVFEVQDVLDFLNEHRRGTARKLAELPCDFFTTVQVASALQLDANVVRRWMRGYMENGMPHFRLSMTWVLFRMEDVNDWLKQQTAKVRRQKERRTNRARKARDYYRDLRAAKKAKTAKEVATA